MDERALHLHALALSVLRSTGTSVAVGFAIVTVYRRGALTMRYWPKQGQLEVWYGSKVLAVERWKHDPDVVHYRPGNWEQELEVAAGLAANVRNAPPSKRAK